MMIENKPQWNVVFYDNIDTNRIVPTYPRAYTKKEAIERGMYLTGLKELASEPYIIN